MSRRKHGKRGHTPSPDFSSKSDATTTDDEEEDKIPIRTLFSCDKSTNNNQWKSPRKKVHIPTK
jgi:hypothetical protein